VHRAASAHAVGMGAGVSPVALFAHHLCLLQKIGMMYGTVQAEVQ